MEIMIQVLHNPRCSKSRCAIDFLRSKEKSFEVIEYLDKPLSKAEMKSVLKKLNIPAEQWIRKNEEDYKTHFKGKTLTDDEWIEAMLKFPKLIERPVVIVGEKAVIARPDERILEIL
jgi:arsenate reductase